MLLYVRVVSRIWSTVSLNEVFIAITLGNKVSDMPLKFADALFVCYFAAVLKINVRNVKIENDSAGLYLLISTGEKLYN